MFEMLQETFIEGILNKRVPEMYTIFSSLLLRGFKNNYF